MYFVTWVHPLQLVVLLCTFLCTTVQRTAVQYLYFKPRISRSEVWKQQWYRWYAKKHQLLYCEVKWSESHSVVSDSLRPHGLYSPWNSPGQNTGVGSLFFLQGIFPTQESNPGLPHCRRILYQLSHKGRPRILQWVPYSFSRGSSQPRNWSGVSCIAGRFFINWATREAWVMLILIYTVLPMNSILLWQSAPKVFLYNSKCNINHIFT